MKLKTFLCLLPIAMCLNTGCQSTPRTVEKTEPAVVGIWESPSGRNHWKFVLLDDGTLSEVIRSDAKRMIISEGGFEDNREGFLLRYVFGPCYWTYDKESNSLKVVVTIDDFHIKMPTSELRCTVIDEFEGPVSEDGYVWTATHTSTMKYDESVPDRVSSPQKIIFTKKR